MGIKKDWLKITLAYLASSVVLYGYYVFFTPAKMNIVYKNWDGPSYTLAALSLYQPQVASENNYIDSPWITPDWTFLPAHFPLFPWTIRVFSFLGYFQAMLLITQVFSVLTLIAFYELVREYKVTKHPLLLTLPMIFLPPRWFIVSHIGASEPMFLFFMLLTLLFWRRREHPKAAVAAALAQLTRPQGALLALAIAAFAFFEVIVKKRSLIKQARTYAPYLLVPVALLGIFLYFKIQTGDFFSFFNSIARFKHSQWPPFRSFIYPNANVETFWQEVNAYNYVVYLASVFVLFRKKFTDLAIVGLMFFLPLPFIAHSDVSRYALPMMPMAYIAFQEIIARKEFTLAALVMSPAIYAYAVNFMFYNHAL